MNHRSGQYRNPPILSDKLNKLTECQADGHVKDGKKCVSWSLFNIKLCELTTTKIEFWPYTIQCTWMSLKLVVT